MKGIAKHQPCKNEVKITTGNRVLSTLTKSRSPMNYQIINEGSEECEVKITYIVKNLVMRIFKPTNKERGEFKTYRIMRWPTCA